jgi:hypothetical protein
LKLLAGQRLKAFVPLRALNGVGLPMNTAPCLDLSSPDGFSELPRPLEAVPRCEIQTHDINRNAIPYTYY